MKITIILLAIAGLVLAGLLIHTQQTAQTELAAAHAQLATTSNDLVVARTEVATVSTQLTNETARSASLEQKVQETQTANAQAEQKLQQSTQQLQALQKQLDSAKHAIMESEGKMSELDNRRQQLAVQLGAVSNQLVTVTQDLATARQTNTADDAQIKQLRQQQAALEMEKASLEWRLQDLDSLRGQIRLVKRELWDKKIAEWKQRDADAAAKGNHGLLLKNGVWTSAPKPAS